MPRTMVTLDANEAAAGIAYQLSEVIAIYPITPSSAMGEWSDQWASENHKNLWDTVPLVAEMQSEGGAMLYGRLNADLAVTGGVHTHTDVLKSLIAGASVTLMTSALLLHGPAHIRAVLGDLVQWMDAHEVDSVRRMHGSMSRRSVAQPAAYGRANYMQVLHSNLSPPASGIHA